MAVVPYCIVEASASVTVANLGVCGASVDSVETPGLRAFYSEVAALPTDGEELQKEALRFHAVVAAVFEQAAVIQFRFPTLLGSVAALREHIEQHAGEYRDFLVRVRELVQMEVRIGVIRSGQNESTSGREYLLSKQTAGAAEEKYAGELYSASTDSIRDWRIRKTQSGLRCFALVARPDVDALRTRMQSVISSNPGVHAVMSGPWPVTEFLDVTVKP